MGLFDRFSTASGDDTDDAADDGGARAEGIDELTDHEPAAFRQWAETLADRSDVPELDFSPASLADLDAIAMGNHPVDDPVVYGSYLGETLVRALDGEWVREDGWVVAIDRRGDRTTVAVFDAARMVRERGPIFAEITDRLQSGDVDGDTDDDSDDGSADERGLDGKSDGDVDGEADDANEDGTDRDVDEEDAAATWDAVHGDDMASAEVITTVIDRAERLADAWPAADLDYRPASLARVDEIVDDRIDTAAFSGASPGDRTDPEALRLAETAAGIGAYYAAVLVRHCDAQWAIDDEVTLAIEGPGGRTRVRPFDAAVARLRGEGSLTERYESAADTVTTDAKMTE